MVKQKVVWTYPKGYMKPTEKLQELLRQGYVVKHLTRRSNDFIEYIVEKEENKDENGKD